MYLKAIELQGFKSFPDRTVLGFSEGITAIVGPNGSGKSNISDAVRWVMGEMSSKTLRGGKMEDVIFGGTQTRAQVGFAEVSLILDNSGGLLSIDSVEVMVTRRLYRSGESEYYINRESVRLRDVYELFMDTGLGKDGYSIIGQGRIDEILSARSEDRREIFEEAAGISKFRHRKEESERKLRAADENLVRINDKISEIELSVGPLREQSETARRFLILRDELRGVEVSFWMDSIERIRQSAEKTRQDFESAEAGLKSAQAEMDGRYKRSEELSEKTRELDIEAERLRGQLSSLEGEAAEARSSLAVIEAAIENTDNNIEGLRGEIENEEARAGGIRKTIDERRARIEDTDIRRGQLSRELSALSDELTRLSGTGSDAGRRVAAILAQKAVEDEQRAKTGAEAMSVEASISELLSRRRAVEGELLQRDGDRGPMQRAAEDIGRRLFEAGENAQGLKNAIKGYELRRDSRRKRFDELEAGAGKLRLEAAQLDSRIRLLSEMERDYEGFSRAVKAVMREKERGALRGVHGTLASLIRAEDRFAVAIETALGAALSNLVVSSEEDGKAGIEFLKRSGEGRATFLPVSAIRPSSLSVDLSGEAGFLGIASGLVSCGAEYRDIVSSFLGRTVVCTDLDAAVALSKKHGARFRIVTLDGQEIRAGGAMTGGSLAKGTGILSRVNELSRLRDSKTELNKRALELDASLREAKRELDAAEYEISVAREKQREAEDLALVVDGERRELEARLESHDAAVSSLRDELLALDGRKSDMEKRLESLRLAEDGHEKNARRLELESETFSGELEAIQSGVGEITGRIAALREESAGLEAERESALSSLSEMETIFREISGSTGRRGALLEEYGGKRAGLALSHSEGEKKLREMEESVKAKRLEIESAGAAKLELEGERLRHDRKLQQKSGELLGLERERARLESRREAFDMEEKQLVDKLWDTYELTRTAAQELRRPLESAGKAQRRIAELKKEISSLGAVNLGAIEEYKRISTRFEFLSSERDDVQSVKTELERIIGDIVSQMKDIFSEKFSEIDRSFSETFREIFRGGRAQLELEDRDDILSCGIEIKVQLPGKNLKTITLLSGGEKAFVAIALYFAILKVRPTPFCVMDEIEAALDDVNVARFALYLRRLTERTQFVVITHRRGTMEEADMLYGVTMEEPGISKMLKLDLLDVERELGLA